MTLGSSRSWSKTAAFCFGFILPSTAAKIVSAPQEQRRRDPQRTKLNPSSTRNGSRTSNIDVNYIARQRPRNCERPQARTCENTIVFLPSSRIVFKISSARKILVEYSSLPDLENR